MSDEHIYSEDKVEEREQQASDEFEKAFDEFAEGSSAGESAGDSDIDDTVSDSDDTDSLEEGNDNDIDDDGIDDDIELLRKQKEELEHYKQSNEGRVAALQRKIDEMMAMQQQPESDSNIAQDDSKDEEYKSKWEELRQDDEFLAEQIEARLKIERELMMRELEQRLAPIQTSETERYIEQQKKILSEKIPDWEDIVVKDEFGQWLEHQPPKVQELASSIEADDYEFLLSAYKAQHGMTDNKSDGSSSSNKAEELQQKRKRRVESAQEVKSRNSGHATQPPADDFEAAFDFYAAEEEKKRKQRGF